jgi:hypothetical protein
MKVFSCVFYRYPDHAVLHANHGLRIRQLRGYPPTLGDKNNIKLRFDTRFVNMAMTNQL